MSCERWFFSLRKTRGTKQMLGGKKIQTIVQPPRDKEIQAKYWMMWKVVLIGKKALHVASPVELLLEVSITNDPRYNLRKQRKRATSPSLNPNQYWEIIDCSGLKPLSLGVACSLVYMLRSRTACPVLCCLHCTVSNAVVSILNLIHPS
jgi:hypothetical protein